MQFSIEIQVRSHKNKVLQVNLQGVKLLTTQLTQILRALFAIKGAISKRIAVRRNMLNQHIVTFRNAHGFELFYSCGSRVGCYELFC